MRPRLTAVLRVDLGLAPSGWFSTRLLRNAGRRVTGKIAHDVSLGVYKPGQRTLAVYVLDDRETSILIIAIDIAIPSSNSRLRPSPAHGETNC